MPIDITKCTLDNFEPNTGAEAEMTETEDGPIDSDTLSDPVDMVVVGGAGNVGLPILARCYDENVADAPVSAASESTTNDL